MNYKTNKNMAQNKERQIASQSQLKLVLDWATTNNTSLTLKELVSISVVLTDYVEMGYSKEIEGRLEKIDNYLKNER